MKSSAALAVLSALGLFSAYQIYSWLAFGLVYAGAIGNRRWISFQDDGFSAAVALIIYSVFAIAMPVAIVLAVRSNLLMTQRLRQREQSPPLENGIRRDRTPAAIGPAAGGRDPPFSAR